MRQPETNEDCQHAGAVFHDHPVFVLTHAVWHCVKCGRSWLAVKEGDTPTREIDLRREEFYEKCRDGCMGGVGLEVQTNRVQLTLDHLMVTIKSELLAAVGRYRDTARPITHALRIVGVAADDAMRTLMKATNGRLDIAVAAVEQKLLEEAPAEVWDPAGTFAKMQDRWKEGNERLKAAQLRALSGGP